MQYGVPRSRYTGLSPLNAARMRLRRVEQMIAQHEDWLVLPPDRPHTVQRPYTSLQTCKELRTMLQRAIGELERRRDQAADLWERRN